MNLLFITPVGKINNLAPISFGLIQALENSGLKVGYLKPIARDKEELSTHLYRELFNAELPLALDSRKAEHYIRHNCYDQILEDVIEKISQLKREPYDLIIVEGLNPEGGEKNPFITRLNLDIARTLSAGVIFAGNSGDNSAAVIAEYLDLQTELFSQTHTWFAGYILNHVQNIDNVQGIAQQCQRPAAKALEPLAVIPQKDELTNPLDVVRFIAENITTINLIERLDEEREERMPPSMFRYALLERARADRKRIILPEGEEPRTIQAAIICAEKGIATPLLIGERATIEENAQQRGLTLPQEIEIITPDNELRERYVAGFVARRKHRGATEESAREALQNNVVLGTMMLAEGDVDGLVSGAIHTTADTIRPALQLIGTDEDSSIVSSIFFMLMSDQVHVYGDCAVNPSPTPEQLADIAIQSAQSAERFGIEPRVAMISYSTGTSGAGEAVEAVAKATKIAQERAPQYAIDGPLQFDAACVPEVGRQKAPDSPVAGHATVFIYPDLNTGNTTYKAVQRSANVVSIGPMLQGLAKPVNDLSRGALVDDIVYTIAITALQAQSH